VQASTANSGQEATTRVIDLEDDEPDIVKRMIEYLDHPRLLLPVKDQKNDKPENEVEDQMLAYVKL
jgi:hypothetical protein